MTLKPLFGKVTYFIISLHSSSTKVTDQSGWTSIQVGEVSVNNFQRRWQEEEKRRLRVDSVLNEDYNCPVWLPSASTYVVTCVGLGVLPDTTGKRERLWLLHLVVELGVWDGVTSKIEPEPMLDEVPDSPLWLSKDIVRCVFVPELCTPLFSFLLLLFLSVFQTWFLNDFLPF